MKRAVLFPTLVAVVVAGGALASIGCDEDDRDAIGENVEEAVETIENIGENIGEEIEEQLDEIFVNETPTATPPAGETPYVLP